jgi:hypothetical protein
MELDTVDLLLLKHQLLEVLSSIWLPLKCLESLGQQVAHIMDRSTWVFHSSYFEAKQSVFLQYLQVQVCICM